MARDAALITTWGVPVPGREAKSLEVFMDFMTFIGKHAADGKVSAPEVFFNYDGSEGFAIVKGRSDAIMEIWESDENQRLLSKAQLYVQDLKSHLYFTGDAEIQRGTQIFSEVINEAGIA